MMIYKWEFSYLIENLWSVIDIFGRSRRPNPVGFFLKEDKKLKLKNKFVGKNIW